MALVSAGASVSVTSELLPEPETPVTTVRVPMGTLTVTSLRLFAVAPRSVMEPRSGWRRSWGSSIMRDPRR